MANGNGIDRVQTVGWTAERWIEERPTAARIYRERGMKGFQHYYTLSAGAVSFALRILGLTSPGMNRKSWIEGERKSVGLTLPADTLKRIGTLAKERGISASQAAYILMGGE